MDLLLTPGEVARILGVHFSTVSRNLDRGLLPMVKTKGGHRRVHVAALRAFLEKQGVAVPAQLSARDRRIRVVLVHPDADARAEAEKLFNRLPERVVFVALASAIDALLQLKELAPHVVAVSVAKNDLDPREVCKQLPRHVPGARVVLLHAGEALSPAAVLSPSEGAPGGTRGSRKAKRPAASGRAG